MAQKSLGILALSRTVSRRAFKSSMLILSGFLYWDNLGLVDSGTRFADVIAVTGLCHESRRLQLGFLLSSWKSMYSTVIEASGIKLLLICR
jgi:hypothetical protein